MYVLQAPARGRLVREQSRQRVARGRPISSSAPTKLASKHGITARFLRGQLARVRVYGFAASGRGRHASAMNADVGHTSNAESPTITVPRANAEAQLSRRFHRRPTYPCDRQGEIRGKDAAATQRLKKQSRQHEAESNAAWSSIIVNPVSRRNTARTLFPDCSFHK
jgi:hypothetical protein